MQLIGNIEIKLSDRSGKISFAIPFRNKTEFYASENKNKKGETSPDFLIWHAGSRIGFLWKNKYTKEEEEKNYLSGNIFAPGFGITDNKMKLVCFEDSKQQKGTWKGLVFWDFEGKKEIDSVLDQEENFENETDGIF